MAEKLCERKYQYQEERLSITDYDDGMSFVITSTMGEGACIQIPTVLLRRMISDMIDAERVD